MTVRTKSDPRTNASFEILRGQIGRLKNQLDQMTSKVSGMERRNTLDIPTPDIPFKIGERVDTDGFFITVKVLIPARTETVRVILIRKNQNQIKSGETSDQAKARARRQAKRTTFRVQCDENDQQRGFVEVEIGPIKPRNKAGDDDKFQLIRLVALDDQGAFAKNPMVNPFGDEAGFPFPALIVDTGGATEFTLGDSSGLVSKPRVDRISPNIVNLESVASDARVGFKIQASEDGTKTFDEQGILEVYAVIRPFSDNSTADDPNGEVDNRYKIGGVIEDRTKKFVIVEAILPLGKRFKWKRNIGKNATGNEPVLPDAEVSFYAGGDPPAPGIPELVSFTLTAEQQDETHTLLTAKFRQPGTMLDDPNARAVLLRRLRFLKKPPNATDFRLVEKYPLLDEEEVFRTGKESTFTYEVKHQANRTGIQYKAELIGINHTDANPIKREAIVGGSSTLNVDVPEPTTQDLITNSPNGNTADDDAIATFRIYSSPLRENGPTFADLSIDTVQILLKRIKSSDDPNDTTDSDTEATAYSTIIEDPTQKFVDLKVPGLKLSRKYRWRRTIFKSGAAIAKSDAGVFVEFVAGKGLVEADFLTTYAPIVTRINKDHSRVICQFDQPQTGDPVAVRNLVLLRRKPNQGTPNDLNTFSEIDRAVLRAITEYSSNTSGNPPNTDAVLKYRKYVEFEVKHPQKTSGIQYAYRITTIADDKKFSPIFTDGNTGDDAPSFPNEIVPSSPSMVDIIKNSPDGDSSSSTAVVVLRVWASDKRGTPAGGTGPGGVITFGDARITTIFAVIRRTTDTAKEPIKAGGSVDPNDHFVDIEFPPLPFGKGFTWLRNIAENSGARTVNATAMVQFSAGGDVSLANVTIAITNVTVIDPRTSDITVVVTQGSTPGIFKRVDFFKRVAIRPGGPTDAVFKRVDKERLLDLDSVFLPGQQISLVFSAKHPQSATMEYFARLVGFSGQQKDSAIVQSVIGSDALPPPTDPPSRPALGRIVTNTIIDDVGNQDVRVVLRIYADESQTKTFSQTSTSKVVAVLRRSGSTEAEPLKFDHEISTEQSSSTFVDIECPGLRAGKSYDWIKNISSSTGGKLSSTPLVAVSFNAGGIGNVVTAITGFVLTPQPRDPRQSRVAIQFNQPSPAVTLKGIKLRQSESAVSGDTLKVVQRINPNDQQDDNGANINSPGTHTITVSVTHKKPPNTVSYQAELVAVGGTNLLSGIFTQVIGSDDNGPPMWQQASNVVTLKWKGTETSGTIKARFTLPDVNMKTHLINKALIRFFINTVGREYEWNPDLAPGADFRQVFGAINFNGFLTDQFFIDLGKGTRVIQNENRPIPSGQPGGPNPGGLPTTIFNDLNQFGGSLTFFFFVINEFNPNPGSSFGSTAATLFWNPNNQYGF
ncbi:MAG: hypothetical protein AB1489_12055 [Acidobacteriota bacterium]